MPSQVIWNGKKRKAKKKIMKEDDRIYEGSSEKESEIERRGRRRE